MASTTIPPFQNTPVASLASTAALVRKTYISQRTKPLAYRIGQLRKLYWAIKDNTDGLLESCKLDLGKSTFEAYLTEIDWCLNDIVFVQNNLEKWMADEKAPDIPLANKLLNPKIRKEPLGAVLVLGCWNFPVQLSLGPLIGAIAAGCTAILKPSEVSPHSAMMLKKIIEESLDPDAYAVVNGGVDESTALLNEKWDKIFYTGSAGVGTIVAKKAAETLTPVCLELGGRNPAIITRNADPRLAARRLLWAKHVNSGQICISQNYMIVDKLILDAFVEQLKIAMKEFYPKGAKESEDYGRIVNKRHFLRIKKMLDDSKGKILIGGDSDESQNYIEPTVLLVDADTDSTIQEESFGPLMPIFPVENLDEAIRLANSVHSTPLAFYPFGNKKEVETMLSQITSGGASINDGFFHGAIPTLAFGGVGDSGQGAYRGKASFDCFSHRRSITSTPGWMEFLLNVRYPPYAGKLSKIQGQSNLSPNFNRNGETIHGLGYLLSFIWGTGNSSQTQKIARSVTIVVVAILTKRYFKGGWEGVLWN